MCEVEKWVELCEEAGWKRGTEVKEVKDNRGVGQFREALGRMLHTKIQVLENSEHHRCPPPTIAHPLSTTEQQT